MSAGPEVLILFTRAPRSGAVKTRLIPLLGPSGAAAFHRRLTEHALRAARQAAARRDARLVVFHDGGGDAEMAAWLGGDLRFLAQEGGDLGCRMRAAFSRAFAEGAARCVLIGADAPGLDAGYLAEAFARLAGEDLVFGPAADGGFTLHGMTARAFREGTPHLGPGMPWGTGRVLAEALCRLRDRGRPAALLPTLPDVDRPGDLAGAFDILCRGPDRPWLTVVIPACDEEALLPATIASLGGHAGVEAILVDGGSRDGTRGIAAASGLRVLAGEPPRAWQMNAGAALAAGDVLLFLHADTRLPPGYPETLRRVLERPGVAAGAFRLGIDAPGKGLRRIERGAAWRCRLLGLPYGDQGLFMRREVFWEEGAFPPLALLEDFAFVRRLRRRGRIALAPVAVATSARRWLRLGTGRAWLINQALVAAYLAGIPPRRLARWYRPRGGAQDFPGAGR
ncbi:MAG: TIGR04283 family arsenosugar biosynthesis glycosyltransferase [Desulfobacterales bacterium]